MQLSSRSADEGEQARYLTKAAALRKNACIITVKYTGGWKAGKQQGTGAFSGAEEAYTGGYTEDKFEGLGIYTWSNGDVYTGRFEGGRRHGDGIKTFADGSPAQEGVWQHDGFITVSVMDQLDLMDCPGLA